MKKLLMGAFLFMAVASVANAQDTKVDKKQCNKTEKCCKEKKADKQGECKDKKKDGKAKDCCKKDNMKKECKKK